MKETKTAKQKLKRLIILSVVAVTVILSISSAVVSAGNARKNYRKIAEVATYHLKDTLETDKGIWSYDEENNTLYCDGKEVDLELFLTINKNDNSVYHTVFWDDTRVLTNIKNAEGNYAVGTQADSKIYAQVKAGNEYSKNGVKIMNDKYTVCYLPIYDEDGFCGMLFTGVEQSSVTKAIINTLVCIFAISVVVFVLIILIANKMLNDISKELSGKMNSSYNNLQSFSENVKEIADRTNDEVSEIAEAMENVASGATSQASATQEAMASTEHFATSIDVVNNEIKDSFDFVESIEGCVKNSEARIDELNSCINDNNRIVDNMSNDIINGVESSKKANSIVKTIDNISFQINLLALNASVEAAHAGEYGQGFAVVADEIKNLATGSAESAHNTAEIISDIVDTMNKAKESNEQLIKSYDEQLAKASAVCDAMNTLKAKLNELVEKLESIRMQSDSQNAVKEELVSAISSLSQNSEQNAAISEQVSASTDNVGTDIDGLTRSIESITDICNEIKAVIEYFG